MLTSDEANRPPPPPKKVGSDGPKKDLKLHNEDTVTAQSGWKV